MEILNKKQKIIVVVLIIIMCIVIGYYIISKTEKYNYSDIEKISNIIEEDQEVDDNIIENKIVIHITGEVEEEGVIELEKGARISDAIEEAGGTTKEADLSNVNLAYSLSDGQKVKIPNINEKDEEIIVVEEKAGDNIIIEGNKSKEEKININKAAQTEIETLPGIGPSTALKIITYRNEHGEFKNIEDIKNVSGIGDSKFENIKEYICVE
ncbi:MAG TPA: helix-hairpin-helix domain-containing protein [Clostridiaceae bacterium]|nr:helix-hairpin-helix domain-containing protein [Clostridiaceae bacterium]